ncbi:GTP-binding protein [Perkinsus chesapeaki]|uniref:GTP-binding protein n=1 Tax=Perkinsus chesapeaki TaxID=330153 RepID=A0A7J6MLC9_PERCH|nr:GTP-binding protein [Perkinsus chesapeaki]
MVERRLPVESEVKSLASGKGNIKENDDAALDVIVAMIVDGFRENTRHLQDIERRIRSGTNTAPRAVVGASLLLLKPSCSHGHHHHDDGDDPIGRKVDELLEPESLREMVPAIIRSCTDVYTKVSKKAKDDGETMPPEVQSYVRRECLLNSTKQEIVSRAKKWLQSHNQSASTEGGTYANPLALKTAPVCEVDGSHPLNRLSSDTIRSLMERGWAVQDGFVPIAEVGKIRKEIELLEFDGHFDEVYGQSVVGIRNDKICYPKYAELDVELYQHLRWLMAERLQDLPFELNAKISGERKILLQARTQIQVGIYAAKGGYYKKHLDGGYNDKDVGRAFSAVVYVNSDGTYSGDGSSSSNDDDGGELVLYDKADSDKAAATRARRARYPDPTEVSVAELSARAKGVEPVLARPWVHVYDTSTESAPWLGEDNMVYARELFSRKVVGYPLIGLWNVERKSANNAHRTPAVVICGRSNVGKSTLINEILYGRQFDQNKYRVRMSSQNITHAPVSNKAGRTRHIFRFDLGDRLRIVDLPGYGFAEVEGSVRDEWATLIERYLQVAGEESGQLQRAISLIDARRGAKGLDRALWDMLQDKRIPFQVVLTKVDLVRNVYELHDMIEQIVASLQEYDREIVWPYVHSVSSLEKHGMNDLLLSLSAIAKDFEMVNKVRMASGGK